MTGPETAQTARASDEATRQWRVRGARLDAAIHRNMRLTALVVAIGLTISVIWVLALG
jgi:hypothetical protein